tara:strand:- start:8271 stop:9134 length:864 start_codon:yes stop_codon:yes gene_type:complete
MFRNSIKKSRIGILKAFSFISGKKRLDDSDLEKFEELLIESDMDLETVDLLLDNAKQKFADDTSPEIRFKKAIKENLPNLDPIKDSKVTMLVGVNGTGKTTFCAKYAKYLTDLNKKVLVIAADTYRAAAYEQINAWSNNYGFKCIGNLDKKDPSSVIFDSLSSQFAKDADSIIIDSAGRLHNSINLMKELRKMSSVVQKFDYSYNNFISIDANTGKNALDQIKLFNEYLSIHGAVLNKVDGSAKGGIGISIIKKNNIPICFLGSGESIDDIAVFNMDLFLESILGER